MFPLFLFYYQQKGWINSYIMIISRNERKTKEKKILRAVYANKGSLQSTGPRNIVESKYLDSC